MAEKSILNLFRAAVDDACPHTFANAIQSFDHKKVAAFWKAVPKYGFLNIQMRPRMSGLMQSMLFFSASFAVDFVF